MEINKLVEVLDKVFGEKRPTNKELITKLFKLLVIGKDDNYKEFKEHVSNIDCLCGIRAYADFINRFDVDELKEIIEETGITEDILADFFHIINERRNELVLEVDTALGVLSSKIYDSFENVEDNKDDKPNFDEMSKEELIKYIKDNNK